MERLIIVLLNYEYVYAFRFGFDNIIKSLINMLVNIHVESIVGLAENERISHQSIDAR